MRFLIAILLLALVSFAYMGEDKLDEKPKKIYKLMKRACVCIKKIPGACLKLKCCETYLLIPEKVHIHKCKYGPCKFEKKIHKKHPEKYPTLAK